MTRHAFGVGEPPARMLRGRKSLSQHVYDFAGSPLRLAILPDDASERLGLTSLRSERFAAVLPLLRGRLLDVGAGDNLLVRLYRREAGSRDATGAVQESVGVDVTGWATDTMIIRTAADLPFANESFDTVSFIACLNHIPERREALRQAYRVLKPGGHLVATMIGRGVGWLGHKIWWYSEDKYRTMAPGEQWGLSPAELNGLIRDAGLTLERRSSFLYGMNKVYVAVK